MTPFLSCDKIECVGNSSAIPKNKKEKREIFKMAVKIRLTRLGSKRNPFYRIVVADARSPRDGRIIEQIGTYNPTSANAPEIKVDEALALKWLNDGAKPSDTVRNILSKAGVMKKFHDSKYSK